MNKKVNLIFFWFIVVPFYLIFLPMLGFFLFSVFGLIFAIIIGLISVRHFALSVYGATDKCPKCNYSFSFFRNAAGVNCPACKTRLVVRDSKLFIP
ncbi:MAG: hypothetical protein KatS3mg101_1105 [Patescibacteria group bacterium]|jgi:DNA-directed RNA polymerase subunit RPC12/RpoP|nr:MAG: hypothetical protein KatS3mg101_1105 [Patescibacteria group bacterium]